MLTVTNLHKAFRVSPLSRQRVHAVRGMSFTVEPGSTVAVVGESGSGKSTSARLVLRLVDPDSGSVVFNGRELTELTRTQINHARQSMPMVFQDPYSSIDPSWTIREVILEPLHARTSGGSTLRADPVELLQKVGLPESFLHRYPYELSGGQRQRVAIARALACSPELLICDEAVAALDVSTRASIINLLKDLQAEHGFGILFITHDLSLVEAISDRVVIVYLGEVVETGPTQQVFGAPRHPYTRLLMDSIPRPDPQNRMDLKALARTGEVPSASNPPPGCAFASRCPRRTDICTTASPELSNADDGGEARMFACHHPLTLTPVPSKKGEDHD